MGFFVAIAERPPGSVIVSSSYSELHWFNISIIPPFRTISALKAFKKLSNSNWLEKELDI
jgi:hypothetical protein